MWQVPFSMLMFTPIETAILLELHIKKCNDMPSFFFLPESDGMPQNEKETIILQAPIFEELEPLQSTNDILQGQYCLPIYTDTYKPPNSTVLHPDMQLHYTKQKSGITTDF